ncbi:MAG TPA: alpha/beta hydrolase [Gammaproteobacteria bacterium]|nr:alpha/beta hydrolase [Gammaproteobacteria bacterium]
MFFSGYASDMSGTKARFLEARAKSRGRAFLRFDYQGHGESSGSFTDGSIGLWSEDARSLIEHVTRGPLVLVGSSMGAWIMLIVALELKHRVAALMGIAAAPDFSEDLILPALTPEQRESLDRTGLLRLPSRYSDEPQLITRLFVEEGRRHLLLRSDIALECPVRLVHGLEDPEVPWNTSLRLARALRSRDVELTLIKGGDHRLSTPRDLTRIDRALESLVSSISPEERP